MNLKEFHVNCNMVMHYLKLEMNPVEPFFKPASSVRYIRPPHWNRTEVYFTPAE